jgi:hypothetical protein
VNKSFFTISRPLRFDTANVFVSDTILLAPAGLSSLHAIGILYSNEGDYNKIEVKNKQKVAAILVKFCYFLINKKSFLIRIIRLRIKQNKKIQKCHNHRELINR